MKRDSWIVGQHAVRPAGKAGECFFCHALIGAEHAAGCVLRKRTIDCEMTFRMVAALPEHWDSGQVEYWYNDSSYCLDTLVPLLGEAADRFGAAGSCLLCPRARVRYVGEASKEESLAVGLSISAMDS
jgi:hypothetical protein